MGKTTRPSQALPPNSRRAPSTSFFLRQEGDSCLEALCVLFPCSGCPRHPVKGQEGGGGSAGVPRAERSAAPSARRKSRPPRGRPPTPAPGPGPGPEGPSATARPLSALTCAGARPGRGADGEMRTRALELPPRPRGSAAPARALPPPRKRPGRAPPPPELCPAAPGGAGGAQPCLPGRGDGPVPSGGLAGTWAETRRRALAPPGRAAASGRTRAPPLFRLCAAVVPAAHSDLSFPRSALNTPLLARLKWKTFLKPPSQISAVPAVILSWCARGGGVALDRRFPEAGELPGGPARGREVPR